MLSDKKKRAQYDAYGGAFAGGQGGPRGGFGGFDFSDFAQGSANFGDQEFDLGDIFGEFFGGSARGTAAGRRGRDISVDIELPFREAVFGTERRMLKAKMRMCGACEDTGAWL